MNLGKRTNLLLKLKNLIVNSERPERATKVFQTYPTLNKWTQLPKPSVLYSKILITSSYPVGSGYC